MPARANRRLTHVSLVVGSILLLTGCSEWGPAPGPHSGGTMSVSLPSLPATWDPDAVVGGPSEQPIRDVEAPLLQLTPHSQQVAPGLARSWKYDASQTHLTLTLRPRAEFSNGHHVRAKDVVFSVDQWRRGPEHGAFYSQLISGVKAHGTGKVVLSLNAPSSTLLEDLTLTSSAIVPDDFGGRTAAEFYARPIGAGPFEVHSTSGDGIDLSRNRHFYDRVHPFLSHLDYTSTSDPAAVLPRVSDGKTDLVEGVPAGEVASTPTHARVVTTASQSASTLTFSPNAAATKNPQLRRAVSVAIDRATLVSSVYDGKADVAPDTPQHDLRLARRDLSSVPGHQHLTVLVDSADPTDVRLAQAITPMLAQAGVALRTLPVDSTTLSQRVASGDYELALRTLTGQTASAADVAMVTPHLVDVVADKVRGLVVSPSGLYHSSEIWLKSS